MRYTAGRATGVERLCRAGICRWDDLCTDRIRYEILDPERDLAGALLTSRGLAALPVPETGYLFFRDKEAAEIAKADSALTRTKVTSDGTKVARRPRPGITGHLACLPGQDHQRGGQGEKGHAMTHNDGLPAEVRRQDEEAERQIAAQLAELGKNTEAIRYVDLGPTVPMWRVGYYKEHGHSYVFLVTLDGPRDNPEVTSQAAVSINDAVLYVRGILNAVGKAMKS